MCHKVVFMTFTINKEYSKSLKKNGNCVKTYPKVTKTSKCHDRHSYGILVVKLGQVSHPMHIF